MKITYSSYRAYLDCPSLYLKERDGVPPPAKPSMYFTLYGKLIESFFKKYTNDITKKGRVLSEDQIRDILDNQWEYLLDKNYVNWEDPWVKESASQIFESVYIDVLKNIKGFDFWKDARSEVTLEILLKKSRDIIVSRLDFIVTNPDNTVEILDGKGTNKPDTNVDVEQLYFYALMYLLKYGKLPDKIGFLFYRFQMIKYIDFDLSQIIDFKNKLSYVKAAIKKDKVFAPKVKLSKQCKWCAYKFKCDEHNKARELNQSKRKNKMDLGGSGLIEFGF